jgi:2-polyprenyl-3-methyl-5-hydroxy-6-metoxy-1,4-benzoquinol methylase
MKEKDIRPQDLLEENTKLLMQDIEGILKMKEDFVCISCPACGSQDSSKLFNKDGFAFERCDKCETVFTNPRPTKDHLSEYYAKSKCYSHYNDVLFPATEDSRRDKIFVPRTKKIIEICEKYNIPKKKLVDVGAGFGTFCEEISKLSVFDEIVAIEPSQSLADTCRKRGISVLEEFVEDVHIENVSIITSFELLEHLFCPKDFIQACRKLLPMEGFLFLTTPNIKGFDMLVLKELNDNIISPNHLNFFHPESVAYLLEKNGFEIVEITTPGKLDVELVSKKVESGEVDLGKQTFLKEVVLSKNDKIKTDFQKFLADNLMSSHMSVLAKRKS